MRHLLLGGLVIAAFCAGRVSGPAPTLEANTQVDCATELAATQARLAAERTNLGVCEQAIAVIDTAAARVQPTPAQREAQSRPISPGYFRLRYAHVGKSVREAIRREPYRSRLLASEYERISLVEALQNESARAGAIADLGSIERSIRTLLSKRR